VILYDFLGFIGEKLQRRFIDKPIDRAARKAFGDINIHLTEEEINEIFIKYNFFGKSEEEYNEIIEKSREYAFHKIFTNDKLYSEDPNNPDGNSLYHTGMFTFFKMIKFIHLIFFKIKIKYS
jgi:hypothetical protein